VLDAFPKLSGFFRLALSKTRCEHAFKEDLRGAGRGVDQRLISLIGPNRELNKWIKIARRRPGFRDGSVISDCNTSPVCNAFHGQRR
jgi:hypothetical protein